MIEATVRCLYRVGYSAVTFAMVAVRDAVYVEERRLVDEERARIGTEAYLRAPHHLARRRHLFLEPAVVTPQRDAIGRV